MVVLKSQRGEITRLASRLPSRLRLPRNLMMAARLHPLEPVMRDSTRATGQRPLGPSPWTSYVLFF